MMLLTKAIKKALPPLCGTDGQDASKRKVPLKLFSPVGAATWYICEMDPESGRMFGLCYLGPHAGEPEMGYVMLSELQALKLPYGQKVERDRYWKGTLADAQEELRRNGAYQ